MSSRFDMPRMGTTWVWWDLNTCPVPADIEPGSVRRRIESALRNFLGGEYGPVTIFAIGNLQYISREILEAISSSGILCYNTHYGWVNIFSHLRDHTLYGATIMLISSNIAWCNHSILRTIDEKDFRVLRAYPKDCRPEDLLYHPADDEKEWDWEDLLTGESMEEETSSQIVEDEDEPAWLCYLCRTRSKSWDVFFNYHLKTVKHVENMFSCARVDEDGKPVYFCKDCNYPAYDAHDIDVHYDSDVHKQKKKLAESSKRTREEDLLNEANKKR